MADKKNSAGEISRGSREGRVTDSDVLVDSGANEVARPYNESWFKEITLGLKGEVCKVGLAGSTGAMAAMTLYGENMFPN